MSTANLFKWLGLALAFSLVLGWGAWQRGDMLYYKGELGRQQEVTKRLGDTNAKMDTELKRLREANKSLIAQNTELATRDKQVDVKYLDRYRTIEKVIREGDLNGANIVLRSLIDGFYAGSEAPKPAN